ncbi:MAG: GNAT family N-acetyltransferase [Bacilli bacterium]|jgi:ribosomal protein S18 acetylase RimI-like enzyme|nr:GNAT family N-acetyltransferase [Bacilli bacterium]
MISLEEYRQLCHDALKFDHSGFTYTVYEDYQDFTLEENSSSLIALFGINKGYNRPELLYSCNEEEELLRGLKGRKDVLVQFISEHWKADLLKRGFQIFGEMKDYWIYGLDGFKDTEKPLFGTEEEAEEISNLTRNVAYQSREFRGEDKDFVLSWLHNDEANLLEAKSEEAKIFLMKENNEIVGALFMALYGKELPHGEVCWIRELAVRQDKQNRGIGRRLLNQALTYGNKKGAKRAFLSADELNEQAKHLYKSCGFIPNEDEQLDLLSA